MEHGLFDPFFLKEFHHFFMGGFRIGFAQFADLFEFLCILLEEGFHLFAMLPLLQTGDIQTFFFCQFKELMFYAEDLQASLKI